MPASKKSLIQVLGEKKKITRDQAIEAMERRKTTNEPLEKILVEMGLSEVDVYEALAETMGVPFLDAAKIQADQEARGLLPEDMQDRYKATPLKREDKRLTVAMENPRDVFAIDEMRMKTGMDIRAVLVPPSQVQAIRNGGAATGGAAPAGANGAAPATLDAGNFDESIQDMLSELDPNKVETDPKKKGKKKAEDAALAESKSQEGEEEAETDLSAGDIAASADMADEAPIIRIVNTILMYAIRDGASDIHIEPQRKGVRVRYRIDGVLHEQMKVPQYVLNPLVSRIKIMADMNIAERRIPQDGRIHVKMQDKDYDFRVNSCPTAYGEKVVMRILDKSSVMIGMDKLGLYPEMQATLLDICHQPNGCFMICGPTGSGKTTTLYSVLNVVNSVEKNVMTVEDPVEYQLPGLSQVHVNRKAGLTFASALRAFLRQDPDIIMIGEIRDLETAEIAVQAALTGHLVLSTIHTNDAPSVPTRLGDMGVEPFLVSASLVGALAQRLARRNCANCKEEYQPQRELLLRFGFDPRDNPDQKFYKGRGCDKCRQTGYKGRLGVYELMTVNEEVAELIVRRAPLSEIKETARGAGMVTLQEDGFRKCLDGMTSVEEIMRVVFTGGH
ncbi:MAG: Flp pilus assembly complex ATPase component TadA [Armatimonadota bacterium]|nr:Flp pilus assembly complex ATPase component TadA [Armatimonadota bacterium]